MSLVKIDLGTFDCNTNIIDLISTRIKIEKIKELSSQVEDMQSAQRLLEDRLSKEIQDKDVQLRMMEKGLVATTHNTEDTTSALICLCCGCCCSQTRGRIAWGNPTAVAPSNFFPKTDRRICTFCGTCAERCMFHAITVDKESRKWRLNPELCIGCGICALGCGQGAVKLHRKDRSSPFKTRQDLYSQIDRENR